MIVGLTVIVLAIFTIFILVMNVLLTLNWFSSHKIKLKNMDKKRKIIFILSFLFLLVCTLIMYYLFGVDSI